MTREEIEQWALRRGWRLAHGHLTTERSGIPLRLCFASETVALEVKGRGHGRWMAVARAAYAEVAPDADGNPLGLALQALARRPTITSPRVERLWRLWSND